MVIVIVAGLIAVIISIYSNSNAYVSLSDAKQTHAEIQVIGRLNKRNVLYYDPVRDASLFPFYENAFPIDSW